MFSVGSPDSSKHAPGLHTGNEILLVDLLNYLGEFTHAIGFWKQTDITRALFGKIECMKIFKAVKNSNVAVMFWIAN